MRPKRDTREGVQNPNHSTEATALRRNPSPFRGREEVTLAWISHSLINPRQHRFVEFVRRELNIDVLEIYPSKWGDETRENGYPINGTNMGEFVFGSGAYDDVLDFEPDLLYLQQELWSRAALQAAGFSKSTRTPLVTFVWENKRPLAQIERGILTAVDGVVCGNTEAEERLPDDVETAVIPQVGIDTELFTPGDGDATHDLVFPSRPSPEKGWSLLEEAVEGTDLTVHRPWEQGEERREYGAMAKEYRRARVCVQPSVTQEGWMEQFNYSVGESLACGLSAVISDCGSLPDIWGDCPAVEVVPEGDVEALRKALLDPPEPGGGREYVEERYGYRAVAERLTTFLKTVSQNL